MNENSLNLPEVNYPNEVRQIRDLAAKVLDLFPQPADFKAAVDGGDKELVAGITQNWQIVVDLQQASEDLDDKIRAADKTDQPYLTDNEDRKYLLFVSFLAIAIGFLADLKADKIDMTHLDLKERYNNISEYGAILQEALKNLDQVFPQ